MILKLMTELHKNNFHEDACESNYISCKHKYISFCQYFLKIEIADSRLLQLVNRVKEKKILHKVSSTPH